MSNCDTTSSLTSQTRGPTSCRLENQCDFAQWRGTNCRPTLPLELGMQGLAYCVLRIARLAAPGFLRIQSAHRWCSICLYPRTIQNIPVHLLTSHNWLVVYLPLWRIWKSMGRMTSHILWLMLMMVNKKLTLINGGVKRWENHLFLWAMASMAIWQCVKTLYPWWTSK